MDMALSHPLPDDLVELIATRFRTLGEPTRIKLLDHLRGGEANVLELTELIGTTQQNISKHLTVLQRAGIVGRRKQGLYSYYRIIDPTVFVLCESVCGSLQTQIASLHQLVGGVSQRRDAKVTGAGGMKQQVRLTRTTRH